jgi:tRNA pseudouridine13 synthase
VFELPAYEPSGQGDHVFVEIEKRDLSTPEAIRRLARALGVRESDVGAAGMKDRQAVTRQRLSLPRPVTPEAALAVNVEGLHVLSATRHEHKLRTGHLAGNRFVLTIRGVAEDAEARARAILERLARPPGAPAFYGEQRFGARGDNAARGRALVRGERPTPPPRDGREKRLLVSAFQSELFNRWLEARIADGLYARVLAGDILEKSDTGGRFETTDLAIDQARLDRGEVAPTGPMFGHAMRSPAAGSEAGSREEAILAAEGLSLPDFARVAKLAEGTRRAAGVPVIDPRVRGIEGALLIEFALPPGAYATVVADEVMKCQATVKDPS